MPNYKFKRSQTIIQPGEMRQTLESIKAPWAKSLAVLLYLVGCRISEALALKRRDLWVEGGYLFVRIKVLKKRAKSASIPVDESTHILRIALSAPFMQEYLLPYLDAHKDPDALLWHYSRGWAWLKIKEGNAKLSPHWLRHSRLTSLAMAGADPFTLQDWAGWSSVTPASSYVHASGMLAARFADRLT